MHYPTIYKKLQKLQSVAWLETCSRKSAVQGKFVSEDNRYTMYTRQHVRGYQCHTKMQPLQCTLDNGKFFSDLAFIYLQLIVPGRKGNELCDKIWMIRCHSAICNGEACQSDPDIMLVYDSQTVHKLKNSL